MNAKPVLSVKCSAEITDQIAFVTNTQTLMALMPEKLAAHVEVVRLQALTVQIMMVFRTHMVLSVINMQSI